MSMSIDPEPPPELRRPDAAADGLPTRNTPERYWRAMARLVLMLDRLGEWLEARQRGLVGPLREAMLRLSARFRR